MTTLTTVQIKFSTEKKLDTKAHKDLLSLIELLLNDAGDSCEVTDKKGNYHYVTVEEVKVI